MVRSLLVAAGIALGMGLLAPAAPAAAQTTEPIRKGIVEVGRAHRGRHGLWLQFGLGAGAEQYSVAPTLDDYSSRLTRPVVSLAIGGTPSRHLRLGGELSSWIDAEHGVTQSLSNLLAVAQIYPFACSGLFLKVGGGLAHDDVSYHDGYADNGDVGFAATAAIGWEIPLGRRVYLAPRAEVIQQWYDRRTAPDYRERIGHLSVAIGFQPGR